MFKTVKTISNYELEIKKSKFIANIYPIKSKEDAEEIIAITKKKYYDARHNCYAYRCNSENETNIYEKASDDGEPSGTAGSPMLDILKKQELQNILVIVTRYFGGILLGTGGLVKAYSDATKLAIESNIIENKEYGIRYKIKTIYENIKNILYVCDKYNIKIIETKYNEKVEMIAESSIENLESLKLENSKSNTNQIEIDIIEKNIIIEKK